MPQARLNQAIEEVADQIREFDADLANRFTGSGTERSDAARQFYTDYADTSSDAKALAEMALRVAALTED